MATTKKTKDKIAPEDKPLTIEEEAFCTLIAISRSSQREAYKEAFKGTDKCPPDLLDARVDERACRLSKQPHIKARLENLRAQELERLRRRERDRADKILDRAYQFAMGDPVIKAGGNKLSPAKDSEQLKAMRIYSEMSGLSSAPNIAVSGDSGGGGQWAVNIRIINPDD